MDLSTTYLGLHLPHPLIVGSGPLTDDLGTVRALEDAGAAALVLRALYEEEINGEDLHRVLHVESHRDSFAEARSFSADAEPSESEGADEYLEHVRRVKQAVKVPVIATLNAVTPDGWVWYAEQLEQAGADALELQMFHSAGDMTHGAAEVEAQSIAAARSVRQRLRIPIAVKLTTLQTAFAHFAKQLDLAGVHGLVLFERAHRADIDLEELEIVRSLPLSDSSELSLRLRATAALSGRVNASLAVAGGVHTARDVLKATMAGAHATQIVSAILQHGPERLRVIRTGIEAWMDEHEWTSLNEMRGNMSYVRVPDPAAFERANIRLTMT